MSYLLFLDESGHDHKNAPYEVRGGIALHAERLWPFVQAIKNAEEASFGGPLHRYKSEFKGQKLLDKDRFKWAAQDVPLDDVARRKHALSFLNKGTQKLAPIRVEFTAFGQACLLMVQRLFEIMRTHSAKLFASVIPRGVKKPTTYNADDFLRKDQVFLLERFFYFLESEQETGLLVLDQTEQTADRRFLEKLERYFLRTVPGRYRSSRIVPSPFFVSSDMSYPVQAADVCIYCINHCFRLPQSGMNAPVRQELAVKCLDWLRELEWKGEGERDGNVFRTYGIIYVADPYS